jgi:hypothetical protein
VIANQKDADRSWPDVTRLLDRRSARIRPIASRDSSFDSRRTRIRVVGSNVREKSE